MTEDQKSDYHSRSDSQGHSQGGCWGYPPWAWYFTKTLLPAQRRL